MIDLENLTATQLMQRMMAHELYVINWTPLVSMEALGPVLKDHLLYIIGLEKSGTLFASGPLTDATGDMKGAGMTIVRARDRNAAVQIANEEPFVKAGLRTATVNKWTINEGRISITIDLSDGTPTLG